MFTASATAGVESERPFCESCVSWARKGRWKCVIQSPAAGALAALRRTKTVAAALEVVPEGLGRGSGSGGIGRLEYIVGACRCGSIATLLVNYISRDKKGEDNSADSIITDQTLSPRKLDMVFSWGEGMNPALIGRRPSLEVRSRPGEPLGMAPVPPKGEWEAHIRGSTNGRTSGRRARRCISCAASGP